MSELNIINNNGQLLADSREVATMVDKRHSDLVRDIETYKQILENAKLRSHDYFIESSYKVNGNKKTYKCYLITKKGCDMVANKMTGEKGVLFTAAYVAKFDEMEARLKPQVVSLPVTLEEAFKTLLGTVEENKILEQQNLIMAPKAGYYDDLVNAEHLTGIRDTAKELGIKENTFILWLLACKYVFRGSNKKLRPYAKYNNDLFQLKDHVGNGSTGISLFITVKGKNTFRQLLKQHGLI
jgi:Rha family phage regulatory protein